ncbi:MAG: protein-export chaperone SecB [Alphaproteobacteria bacterium]|nr:protein-export chaperone SecB [Alphaproteobacteria bacterium]
MSEQPDIAQPPQVGIVTQYVRDLSFESPNAPQALVTGEARPEIQVGVDVQARSLSETEFEVVLRINAEARRGDKVSFIADLQYAGLFSLRNVPKEMMQPLLLIEAPRLLFPFARRVVADATRDGGFPPLMLDPIDFAALYQRQRQEAAAQPAGTA